MELTNGTKPSEIKQPGTYIVVRTTKRVDKVNPAEHVLVFDIWLDARGVARYRDGRGQLPELLPSYDDASFLVYGPLVIPPEK